MVRFSVMMLATATLAMAMCRVSIAANANDFLDFSYDRSNNGTIELPGRLFVPTNYDSSKQYPIVLFFHGKGEYGSDNTSQVNGNIDHLLAAAKSRDFFLYAPQSGSPAWSTGAVTQAMDMVNFATRTYNIDTSKIYTTGLSAGGGAAKIAITNYVDTFAAAVPVCGVSAGDPTKLVGKPIWVFHARDDGTVNISQSHNFINDIRAANGGKPKLVYPLNASTSNPYYNNGSPYYSDGSTFYNENNLRYTEYASGDHGIWGRAYNEQPMYDWLLSQSHLPHKIATSESVLFDFGSTTAMTAPDAQGRTWNSASLYVESTIGPAAFSYALASNGQRTSISLSIPDKFGSSRASGAATGSIYPTEVAQDSWATYKSDPAAMELDGLDPLAHYRLTIFASDTDSDGTYKRNTRYTIGGLSYDLDIINNLDKTVVFQDISPDASGRLLLTVSAVNGSRYASISSLELTAVPVPEPASLGLLALALLACRRPRRCAC